MNSPCYKCEKRESGCHDKCEAYREFKMKVNDFKEKRSKAREFDIYMVERVIRRVNKSKR